MSIWSPYLQLLVLLSALKASTFLLKGVYEEPLPLHILPGSMDVALGLLIEL